MSRKDKKMTAHQLTQMAKSNAELIGITNTRIDFMAEAVMGDLESRTCAQRAIVLLLKPVCKKKND